MTKNHTAERLASDIAYALDRKREVEELASAATLKQFFGKDLTAEEKAAAAVFDEMYEEYVTSYEQLYYELQKLIDDCEDVAELEWAYRAACNAHYAIAREGRLVDVDENDNIGDLLPDEEFLSFFPDDASKALVSDDGFVIERCYALEQLALKLDRKRDDIQVWQDFAEEVC